MNNEERDRISFDLMGLRQRLEKVAWEPGQPLSSVLRGVAFIGVEIIEVCQKLRMPEPKAGQVEEWLTRTQDSETQNKADEVLNFLSATDRPADVEIVKIASRLNIETEKLLDVCDRLYSKEHCHNGH